MYVSTRLFEDLGILALGAGACLLAVHYALWPLSLEIAAYIGIGLHWMIEVAALLTLGLYFVACGYIYHRNTFGLYWW